MGWTAKSVLPKATMSNCYVAEKRTVCCFHHMFSARWRNLPGPIGLPGKAQDARLHNYVKKFEAGSPDPVFLSALTGSVSPEPGRFYQCQVVNEQFVFFSSSFSFLIKILKESASGLMLGNGSIRMFSSSSLKTVYLGTKPMSMPAMAPSMHIGSVWPAACGWT